MKSGGCRGWWPPFLFMPLMFSLLRCCSCIINAVMGCNYPQDSPSDQACDGVGSSDAVGTFVLGQDSSS